MRPTILVGNTVEIRALFKRRLTDARLDPTTVAVVVEAPDGTNTTYTYGTDANVVRISTGLHAAEVEIDAAGLWRWLFQCSGPVTGAVEGEIEAVASSIT